MFPSNENLGITLIQNVPIKNESQIGPDRS